MRPSVQAKSRPISRTAALLLLATTVGGCVSRPAGTDLFGRAVVATATSSAAAEPGQSRLTVSDVDSDRLLAGIVLRLLPTTALTPRIPIVTDARTVFDGSTVVRPGDTLHVISDRSGAGIDAIAVANSLTAPFTVRIGQRLAIPGGRYHLVRAGQTGIAIARAYGVDWGAVVVDNRLVAPFALQVGQRLRLPSVGSVGRDLTPEERALAFILDVDDIVTGSRPASAGVRPVTAAPPVTRTFATGPSRFAWPLSGRLLQRFGAVGGGRVNDGIKIAASFGAPVRSAGGGIVIYAGTDVPLLGGLVLVDHGGGWISAYGHLDRVSVRTGDRITIGAIIATAGESGQIQEPQLHFELRQDRRPVDPLSQLPPQ